MESKSKKQPRKRITLVLHASFIDRVLEKAKLFQRDRTTSSISVSKEFLMRWMPRGAMTFRFCRFTTRLREDLSDFQSDHGDCRAHSTKEVYRSTPRNRSS